MSYRGSYQIGAALNLRTVFTDVNGSLMDADANPTVYIYDDSVDDEVRVQEIEDQTFTSAVATVASTKLSTGYYNAAYTVATEEGVVYEIWVAEIDGAAQVDQFTWTATAGATVKLQTPGNNTMIIIELDGLADADGNEIEETLFYTTKYVPMYASPDLLRMEVGAALDDIPNDTLALMIHWSSKEADFIQCLPGQSQERLKFARAKYVMYDAAVRALIISGSSGTGGGTQKKSLGDLSISHGSGDGGSYGDDQLARLKGRRDEWFRVLNAGGDITPGQSFDPQVAVKGRYDPDRRNVGRLWESTSEFAYEAPGTNQKRVTGGRRRGRFGMYPRTVSPASGTKYDPGE